MVNYGRKKQCEVRDEVFHGPPNFVLDVFDDAADENYLRRRDRFSRYGVHEYVAILNDDPKALAWHRLDARGYRSVEPDDDGIFRSEALLQLLGPAECPARPRLVDGARMHRARCVAPRELQLNQGCRRPTLRGPGPWHRVSGRGAPAPVARRPACATRRRRAGEGWRQPKSRRQRPARNRRQDGRIRSTGRAINTPESGPASSFAGATATNRILFAIFGKIIRPAIRN